MGILTTELQDQKYAAMDNAQAAVSALKVVVGRDAVCGEVG